MASTIVSHNSYGTVVSLPGQSAEHPPKQRGSVYEIITEQVIKQLESGVAPWRKLDSLMPLSFLNLGILHWLWGGPPGPQPAPWPASRQPEAVPCRRERPTGASAADPGVRPTFFADVAEWEN